MVEKVKPGFKLVHMNKAEALGDIEIRVIVYQAGRGLEKGGSGLMRIIPQSHTRCSSSSSVVIIIFFYDSCAAYYDLLVQW